MEKLSKHELKNIVYKICSEELKKHNLNTNIVSLTTLEYYIKYIPNRYEFNKNNFNKLKKIPFSHILAYNNLFDDGETDIIIFLDKFKNIDNQLLNIVNTCFHEIRHSMQRTFDDYSYEKLLTEVDKFLRNCYPYDYKYNHKHYSNEIGANMYAINMTKEFLRHNYPNIYKEEKDNIEKKESNIKADYILYDATDRVNKAINAARLIQVNINSISPLFNIFMGDDNSFKPIENMIKNPNFDALDKRIIYTVLSSDLFLKNIEIEKLSDEELNTLNEALQYTHTVYCNQYNFLYKSITNNSIDPQSIIKLMYLMGKISQKKETIEKYISLLNNTQNKEQYQYEFIKNKLKGKNIEIL